MRDTVLRREKRRLEGIAWYMKNAYDNRNVVSVVRRWVSGRYDVVSFKMEWDGMGE